MSILIFELLSLSTLSIFYMKSTSKDAVHFFLSFFYSRIQTVEKLQEHRTWPPCFRQSQHFKQLVHLAQWYSAVPISGVGKEEQERPIWFVPPNTLFFHLSRFPELSEFFSGKWDLFCTYYLCLFKKKSCTNGRLCLYLLLLPGHL